MSAKHYAGVKLVDEDVERVTDNVKISWIPFLRQVS